MSIALDIGAFRMKSLRREGERLVARGSRCAHSVLPDNTASRNALDRAQLQYATCEESLLLFGDSAEDFARLFQSPCLSLLTAGHIPHDDPPARQVLATLVEAALPEPHTPGEICCLTLPEKRDSAEATDRELEFFSRVVKLRGYEPIVLGAGMAAILAELVDCGFTGMGIDFGAATTEVSLAHRGIELARCVIPRGGNWIDAQLAEQNNEYAFDANGNRYLDTESARCWKEDSARSLNNPADEREAYLVELYSQIIAEVLDEAASTFAANPGVCDVPQPVDIVCTGGMASIGGFSNVFERFSQDGRFPVDIGRVRVCAESDYTVARGCLICAELESETRSTTRQAA
jgi:pilus assembly protein FimV